MIVIPENNKAVDIAVKALQNSELVLMATETVYIAAVDATNTEAVKKLVAFKNRPFGKPFSVGVTDISMAKKYVVINKTAKDLLKKPELQPTARLEGAPLTEIEFIFKGGTADMALVQVRKLYKDKWWNESFTVKKAETIGGKKTIGRETVDFDTYCKLIEITPQAQKPLIIKKTTVVQNEKGEFLGSSFTEETHMISSSKIIFVDKKGEFYNSWIGESVKVGTDTVSVYPSTNAPSTN